MFVRRAFRPSLQQKRLQRALHQPRLLPMAGGQEDMIVDVALDLKKVMKWFWRQVLTEGPMSKQDGTSINQFVVMAVSEKVAAMNTAAFFEERKKRGNRKAFRRILNREGGEPPRPGDEPSS